jgi:S-adenosylmethionine hydrolase
MAIITLITDFGASDGYVGAVKGVLARLAPEARVLDIAHDIPRGDIAHAAWVVHTSCREFPADTVHLVVVDPGVGGARPEVIVRTTDQWFVGPDNGVFSYLGDDYVAWSIVRRGPAAATFHGRDVFAPAAAALATYDYPFGGKVRLAGALPWGPRPAGEGRIVHVDHYGNLISDLPGDEAGVAIAIAGRRLAIGRTYEDVAHGELLAYVGSAGTVEIAMRDGRADRALEAPRGTRVVPVAGGDAYR